MLSSPAKGRVALKSFGFNALRCVLQLLHALDLRSPNVC